MQLATHWCCSRYMRVPCARVYVWNSTRAGRESQTERSWINIKDTLGIEFEMNFRIFFLCRLSLIQFENRFTTTTCTQIEKGERGAVSGDKKMRRWEWVHRWKFKSDNTLEAECSRIHLIQMKCMTELRDVPSLRLSFNSIGRLDLRLHRVFRWWIELNWIWSVLVRSRKCAFNYVCVKYIVVVVVRWLETENTNSNWRFNVTSLLFRMSIVRFMVRRRWIWLKDDFVSDKLEWNVISQSDNFEF